MQTDEISLPMLSKSMYSEKRGVGLTASQQTTKSYPKKPVTLRKMDRSALHLFSFRRYVCHAPPQGSSSVTTAVLNGTSRCSEKTIPSLAFL